MDNPEHGESKKTLSLQEHPFKSKLVLRTIVLNMQRISINQILHKDLKPTDHVMLTKYCKSFTALITSFT